MKTVNYIDYRLSNDNGLYYRYYFTIWKWCWPKTFMCNFSSSMSTHKRDKLLCNKPWKMEKHFTEEKTCIEMSVFQASVLYKENVFEITYYSQTKFLLQSPMNTNRLTRHLCWSTDINILDTVIKVEQICKRVGT